VNTDVASISMTVRRAPSVSVMATASHYGQLPTKVNRSLRTLRTARPSSALRPALNYIDSIDVCDASDTSYFPLSRRKPNLFTEEVV
jgi:hypothetical protein